MLKLGIIAISHKENEKRVPIHPADFPKISPLHKPYIYIDTNYGSNFGYTDDQLRPHVAAILPKQQIYTTCDIILILKYTRQDYLQIPPNKICWGWHHLVQNKENVDIITNFNKQLTAISLEAMYENNIYIFNDNRIIAGYSSVLHAFQLKGLTGYLSQNNLKAAIISYGNVGKGALDGLLAMDIKPHLIDKIGRAHV